MLCKTKFAIRFQKLQKNPLNNFRKRIKNALKKWRYFGNINEFKHYSLVDT